tara:strand:- start:310 stop:543 length:234 start_codon:yes stop_codon:yes gene_type:complete
MKYKVKRSKLMQYLFNDTNDLRYWAETWVGELEFHGKTEITVQGLLECQNEIPTYIVEDYKGEEEYIKEISEIKIIE